MAKNKPKVAKEGVGEETPRLINSSAVKSDTHIYTFSLYEFKGKKYGEIQLLDAKTKKVLSTYKQDF